MTRSSTVYLCNKCGAQFHQLLGRCIKCLAWNSLVEQNKTSSNRNQDFSNKSDLLIAKKSEPIEEIKELFLERIKTGYTEFDRVLGGGLVPGSLVLIGGDPGIGKSTLLLQSSMMIAKNLEVLYVSAEESPQQVKLRWNRLAESQAFSDLCRNKKLRFLAETELGFILDEIELIKPAVVIIDSIQTIYATELSGGPGSVTQVRECTNALQKLAKREGIALILVGHITKGGALAGPKVLEHLVDVVLSFEGDRFANYKLLRATKNRFGEIYELGVFEMHNYGLAEVHNPFELLLGSNGATPGVATIVTHEGTRPLVLEMQALVNSSKYNTPRRTATGVQINRLHQILAVLEKHEKIPFSNCDCYVAAVGGLRIEEPGADLGLAVALVSSYRNIVVPPHTVFIAELGLGGKLRSVNKMRLRLLECARLGFRNIIIPKIDVLQIPEENPDLNIIVSDTIADAVKIALTLKDTL
uniref:DNA repair protein RadA n=1 Tax=Paulinella longichromatophora TaxID=1708747 RepID=A0A2H4ZP51_9EUKA|nr:DNA repair protein RadA [Paulinella longichromatophora]